MSLVLIIFQIFILKRINKSRDDNNPRPEDYTSEQKKAEMDLGDRASFFRYTI